MINGFNRRPGTNQSSAKLEEIDVELHDGTQMRFILKHCSSLTDEAQRTRPPHLYDSTREIEVYETLLRPANLGTPECFFVHSDPDTDEHWIILERVPGVELYQVGDMEIWKEVARWLARMHEDFQTRIAPPALLNYNEELLTLWLERAAKFTPGEKPLFDQLARNYDTVLEHIFKAPRTIIHGEFYPSNIIVNPKPLSNRISPIDWELAGIGPSILDLAALTAGRFTEKQRTDIANAYQTCQSHLSELDFLRTLNASRLQIALQWLGWAADWRPPAGHAHDWLADVKALTTALGF